MVSPPTQSGSSWASLQTPIAIAITNAYSTLTNPEAGVIPARPAIAPLIHPCAWSDYLVRRRSRNEENVFGEDTLEGIAYL